MSISVIQGVLRIPAAQEKIRQKGIEKPGFPDNYTLIDPGRGADPGVPQRLRHLL